MSHDAVHGAYASRASTSPRSEVVRGFLATKTYTTVVFTIGLMLLGGFGVSLLNDPFRRLVKDHLSLFDVAVSLVVLLLVVVGTRRLAVGARIAERTGLFIFVALPVVIAVVTAAMLTVSAEWQLMTLRVVFLSVVIFLPAIMWWLFIASQKASLLNEFLTNLDRFGLLAGQSAGTGVLSAVPEDARTARVRSYLKKFEASFGDLPDKVYDDVLEGRFCDYGRDDVEPSALSTSTVPVALATAVIAVGWLLILPPHGVDPASHVPPVWLHTLEPSVTPVTLAFLGAYFFSIQMLFRRYARRDLRGSAYVTVIMRIILAMIGIWVLSAVGPGIGVSDQWQLLLIGFVVGVFPQVLWQIVRSAFANVFHRALPSMQAELSLDLLDGLTVWHEARLEEEDVENVPNMATADIVELLVSTRFPAERIVSWVDQAILLTQLGTTSAISGRCSAGESSTGWPGIDRGKEGVARPAADLLAKHGIRTASQLIAVADATAHSPAQKRALLSTLQDREVLPNLQSLLSVIRNNDNLRLILTWHYAQTGNVRAA
jgi:hypothetical protein